MSSAFEKGKIAMPDIEGKVTRHAKKQERQHLLRLLARKIKARERKGAGEGELERTGVGAAGRRMRKTGRDG